MTPSVFDVTDKKVFITGAGRGIGKGIAQVFAAAGADVAINALTPKYVTPLAEGLAKETGRTVVPVIGDVTTVDGAQKAVDAAIAYLGRIDVLINALGDSLKAPLVGLPGEDNAGEQVSEADLNFIMNINITEALVCTRAVGPHMLERGSGKIINVSSWTGHQGGGNMVLYTTAKAGLDGFTRAQALEWAPHGIHVNCIAPGLYPDPDIATPERLSASKERAKNLVPLGRTGGLKECGYLALYLASAASDYMTGQVITLDGGMSL